MILELTQSSIKSFLNCQREYYWKHYLRLVPRENDRKLSVGAAFHKLYETNKPEDVEYYGLDWPDVERVKAMYSGYRRFNGNLLIDNSELRSSNERNEIKKTITLKHYRGLRLSGIADSIWYSRYKENRTFLVERKTAAIGSIDAEYPRRLQNNFQLLFYAHLFGINDFIYDVIEKTRISPKQNETHEEFVARLNEVYADDKLFHRFEINITNEQLQVFYQNLALYIMQIRKLHNLLRQGIPSGASERLAACNYEACHTIGRGYCPYYKLCHEAESQKEQLIKVYFKNLNDEE